MDPILFPSPCGPDSSSGVCDIEANCASHEIQYKLNLPRYRSTEIIVRVEIMGSTGRRNATYPRPILLCDINRIETIVKEVQSSPLIPARRHGNKSVMIPRTNNCYTEAASHCAVLYVRRPYIRSRISRACRIRPGALLCSEMGRGRVVWKITRGRSGGAHEIVV